MAKHIFLFFCICCFVVSSQAQDQPQRTKPPKNQKPPITYYKLISHQRDTTYLDTSLTIQKHYKYNYLRRDNFELQPFANVGQTYNSLAIQTKSNRLKPLFAAQSHHFNYKDTKDVTYFNVATPLTELYFKTAFEQGQQLDAFFTVNTSKQFNFSLAYKGVRSLGNYQQSLTSTGNFLFTTNYQTKNKRYQIRAHVAAQDVLNRENGGLTQNSLALFTNNDSEFSDRGRLDVNFEDAENKLEGLRFYGDHQYALIQKNDSTSTTTLTIGNSISYEDKFFEYRQETAYEPFGASYEPTNLITKTKLEDFNISAYVDLSNERFGNFKAFTTFTDYNYGYNTLLTLDSGTIPNRLKGNLLAVGGAYTKQYKGFKLAGEAAINISGDFDGNYIKGSAGYQINTDLHTQASIHIHSAAPNFNFLLYQNDYVNYNWHNQFSNINTRALGFKVQSKKLANLSVTYTGIDNYTYFSIIRPQDAEPETVFTPSPQQATATVNHLKIKAEREISWKQFALNNTIMYQNVLSGTQVYNVPQIVTRQTLYYKDSWFKKALYLETGIDFKYFSSYTMNAYDPVLAEFYVQNSQEIGGFPMLDLFFNGKIRQTRIYIKWEHFNTIFSSQNQYFSAPNYPYRDAVIRFGLVWDFFL